MEYIIGEKEAGLTVKQYLYDILHFSSASVKRVKYREGGIMLDGERVTVRRVLQAGDVLTLAFEDREQDENIYTVPVNLDIGIVYEDRYITVVDKPPFMPSHPSQGHKLDTVGNALAFRYRDKPFVFRPVNRLDRDTSGLMIVARDKVTAGKVYRSMRKGEIQKSYLAILDGVLPKGENTLESFMCREGDSIVKRRICKESDDGAKRAVTVYRVLSSTDCATLVRAEPVTGRTHQLRLHFSSIGCPITGDTLYGRESMLISRQALHAEKLSFVHPESGKRINLRSPLPSDMEKLVRELGLEYMRAESTD